MDKVILEPRLVCNLSTLASTRVHQITNLLSPIAKQGKNLNCRQLSVGRKIIYGASDSFETGIDYMDWRFKTYVDDYNAMYYERWVPMAGDKFFLERAYFHIYQIHKSEDRIEEYILLHCDPGEPKDSAHLQYKVGPHLHVYSAAEPYNIFHIGLNNSNIHAVSTSIEDLDYAFAQAVQMIDHQILFQIGTR